MAVAYLLNRNIESIVTFNSMLDFANLDPMISSAQGFHGWMAYLIFFKSIEEDPVGWDLDARKIELFFEPGIFKNTPDDPVAFHDPISGQQGDVEEGYIHVENDTNTFFWVLRNANPGVTRFLATWDGVLIVKQGSTVLHQINVTRGNYYNLAFPACGTYTF